MLQKIWSMAWVASLFLPGSISWGSCTDDQAVLFIEVFRLFCSFCSVQNILCRICFLHNILYKSGKYMDFIAKPGWLSFGRGQARPAQQRPLGLACTEGRVRSARHSPGVSLVSAHLHAQKEVRVEAAAGYLTSMPAMTACSTIWE